jgi:hypothetical protein
MRFLATTSLCEPLPSSLRDQFSCSIFAEFCDIAEGEPCWSCAVGPNSAARLGFSYSQLPDDVSTRHLDGRQDHIGVHDLPCWPVCVVFLL